MSEKLMPLKMVQDYKFPFPCDIRMWEFIERIIKKKNADGIVWNEKCYIPEGILFNFLKRYLCNYYKDTIPKDFLRLLNQEVRTICVLAHWRRFKEVYRFDTELMELLYGAADTWENDKIPTVIFESMPFPCFYIEEKFSFCIKKSEVSADGFFVYFNQDQKFSNELNGGTLYFYFKLDNGVNIYLPFNIYEGETINYKIDKLLEVEQSIEKESLIENSTKAMQLVIYICSLNAEITENNEQKKIMRRKSNTIIDKYREVRKWDVGVRIGDNIRLIKNKKEPDISGDDKSATNDNEKRNRPRPHVRKAHWRVYKEGVRGRNKTKVVFIHEQTINTDNPDKITAIIHNNKI